MVKGQKLPTPTDPEEADEYRARRKKNNESAAACRKRKEQRIKEGEQLKKHCEYLEAQLAEKDRENRRLHFALLQSQGPQAHHDQHHSTFKWSNDPAYEHMQHAPHVAYTGRHNHPIYAPCEHKPPINQQAPYGGRCIAAPDFVHDGFGYAQGLHHNSESHEMSSYHGEPYQPNNPVLEAQVGLRDGFSANYPVQPQNTPSSRYSLNSFSSTDSSAVPSPVHNPYQNTSLFQSPTQPARQFLSTFLGPQDQSVQASEHYDDEEDERPGDFDPANFEARPPRQPDKQTAGTATAQDKLTPCSQYLRQAGGTDALPVLATDDIDMLSPLFETNVTLDDQPASNNIRPAN